MIHLIFKIKINKYSISLTVQYVEYLSSLKFIELLAIIDLFVIIERFVIFAEGT